MSDAVTIPSWFAVFVGLLGALGGLGGLAAFLRSRGENKKLQADAAKVIQEAAAAMVEQYAADVKQLKIELRQLKRELAAWQKYAAVLWDFICRHGLDGADELPRAPRDLVEGGGE
jgi:hypothetical protein